MTRLLLILALLIGAAQSALAGYVIRGTLTVTNAANIVSTNGYTIEVEGDTRTLTNSVIDPATQVLTATNNATMVQRLVSHFAIYPVTGLELTSDLTTYLTWRQVNDAPLAITLNTNTWGKVTYLTNTTASGIGVRVPYTAESAVQQTNIANGLSDWLNLDANTTGISAAKLLSGTVPLARLSGITTNEIASEFYDLVTAAPDLSNLDADNLTSGTVPLARLSGITTNEIASAFYDWIDAQSGTDDQTAAEVAVTPAGAIVATNVQAALEELDAEKQPLDADLTDLADGSLTGSKVGTGIDADNITAGTVAEARIHADIARDSEVAAVIDDTAYDVSWDADTTHAPSKNAVYDKIETILAGGGLGTGDIDTSAELRSIVGDESGTGALIFAGGDIGAATATTPSAGDSDTSVATTAFVQGELDATQTGTHASPDTNNPLAPTWTSPMHTVWYGATGEIDLPAVATYTGRGILIYNTGAFTVTIDPNGAEVIVRDGTVQTGGVSMTLSSGAGNYVAIFCDGARWITLGYKGTLSVGT